MPEGDPQEDQVNQMLRSVRCYSPGATRTEQTTYSDFRSAYDVGAGCAELFGVRNMMDPKDPDKDKANRDLRRVSCGSISGTRKDPPESAAGIDDPLGYRVAYELCSRREDLFAEAGTREFEAAAKYYVEGDYGETMESDYLGCLDALEGKPNRFGD